jgi:hypothetical protein
MRETLSSKTNELLGAIEQLHDGRWLWIRVKTTSDIEDVKELLQVKRKPRKR